MQGWEEKSFCHVTMVAKFLDDNKLSHLKAYLHYFKLHQSYLISFNLANLGEIFFGTVSIVIWVLKKKATIFVLCTPTP